MRWTEYLAPAVAVLLALLLGWWIVSRARQARREPRPELKLAIPANRP